MGRSSDGIQECEHNREGNISKFILDRASPGLTIWNITDKGNIGRMNGISAHDTISFIIATDSLKEFIAFDGQSYDSVKLIEKVVNQNLMPSTRLL